MTEESSRGEGMITTANDPVPLPAQKTAASSVLEGVRYEHLISGIVGGAVASQVLHPLDLVRIRLSVDDGTASKRMFRYNGTRAAMKSIFASEGIRGLYRGASAGILGSGTSWGLYFLFFNAIKHHYQEERKVEQLSAAAHLGCAALSGVVTLSVTNPLFVVKTRLCLQTASETTSVVAASTTSNSSRRVYTHVFDGLWKLARYEGVRGMYKGFAPGLLGVSHGSVQLMSYEELKKLYCNHYNLPITEKLTSVTYLAVAASSKVTAVVLTFPIKVIKSRLMQKDTSRYQGIFDVLRKTYRHEGWRGFYKGLLPNLIRVTPSVCITFVIYENLSRYLLHTSAAPEEELSRGVTS